MDPKLSVSTRSTTTTRELPFQGSSAERASALAGAVPNRPTMLKVNNRWYAADPEKFFCVPRRVACDAMRYLSASAFRTYILLCLSHYEDHETFPSGSALGSKMGIDARAVRGHLEILVAAGLVTRIPKKRGYRYVFQLPDAQRIQDGLEGWTARVAAKALAKAEPAGESWLADLDDLS